MILVPPEQLSSIPTPRGKIVVDDLVVERSGKDYLWYQQYVDRCTGKLKLATLGRGTDQFAIADRLNELRSAKASGLDPKDLSLVKRSEETKEHASRGRDSILSPNEAYNSRPIPNVTVDLFDSPASGLTVHPDGTREWWVIRGGAREVVGKYPNVSLGDLRKMLRAEQIQAVAPEVDASACPVAWADAPKVASLKRMNPPPWVKVAREDLDATSAMFAVEFVERLVPALFSLRSTDDLYAAARRAFIETVEAPDAAA